MTDQGAQGTTPLTEEEREGLIPEHIATVGELNEWEHANIEVATIWAMSRKRPELLTVQFVRELHRRMFGETWKWAGNLRKSDKNIGVPKQEIAVQVRNACDDASYWVNAQTYSLHEIAARYHHRLVWIHPFPNGNGRHARLSADLLLFYHDLPPLNWGGEELRSESAARRSYVRALKAADDGDFTLLAEYLGIARTSS